MDSDSSRMEVKLDSIVDNIAINRTQFSDSEEESRQHLLESISFQSKRVLKVFYFV